MATERFSPQLEDVIKAAVEARLIQLHTSMPGIVQSYDAQKQLATVRPALKRTYGDGTLTELPLLIDIPVAHPRANGAHIHLPLKEGDSVMVIFSERSLENWIAQGGVVDPDDPRKHHLSDAYCYPGLYPENDPFTVADETSIEIVNQSSEIHIKTDGTVSIKGTSVLLGDHSLSEFVAIASKVKQEIESLRSWSASHTHLVSTTGGPTAQTGTAAAPVSPPPTVNDVGSAKVKVAT
jgi:hypothetical protein